jgi:AcrR family transcriptional regulator
MTKPTRRSQAERSGNMRARLAKAAFEVIAERGHSAFRTAAVLSHAGVSQGAMLYHFPTKDALTLAAIDYALMLDSDASQQRMAQAGTSAADILSAMAADFRNFFLGNRFWVALDITMDAAKDPVVAPAIRDIVGKARRPIYEQWTAAFVRCGWPDSRASVAVTSTAALVSGYAIRTLWNDDAYALDIALSTWFDCLLKQPD